MSAKVAVKTLNVPHALVTVIAETTIEVIEYSKVIYNLHNKFNPMVIMYEKYELDPALGLFRCKYPAFGVRAPLPLYGREVYEALLAAYKKFLEDAARQAGLTRPSIEDIEWPPKDIQKPNPVKKAQKARGV